MSLPSYVVNLDELNRLISKSLKGHSDELFYSANLKNKEVQYNLHCTDLQKQFVFRVRKGSLIFGLQILESSYELGNYCKILIHKDNGLEYLGTMLLSDCSTCLFLDNPLIVEEDLDLVLEYFNETGTTKLVVASLRYLEAVL